MRIAFAAKSFATWEKTPAVFPPPAVMDKVGRCSMFQSHFDHYLAALGEFDGVAHEIYQDLPQPNRIPDHRIRHVGLHLVSQFRPLLMRPDGQGAHGVADVV